LFIRRLLLEPPFSFLASPDCPADEAGSGSAMLHAKQSIPFLMQVLYSRDIQSHKMIRRDGRLRNPDVPKSRYTGLSFCQFRSHSTQGRRRSRNWSVDLRSTSTLLLHRRPSARLGHGYRNHCELPLQRCLPP